MEKEKIEIEVTPEVAEVFRSASAREREALGTVVTAWLRDRDFDADTVALARTMDEIGANAQRRGLTPEVLEELLRDE